jgi:REP element-mobilizing transposase RayT
MGRLPRYQAAGAIYHVTSRGTGPCVIFDDESDRRTFLSILDVTARRLSWTVHAYCLMDTHYHVLVETEAANIALGMQRINSLYATSYNRRHSRVGALFQGRYGACVVQTERHYAEIARYIALNPVKAGLCNDAEAWPWSGYPEGAAS